MHEENLVIFTVLKPLVHLGNSFTILNDEKEIKVYFMSLQMAVNGRKRRRWTPLSLSTASRAWLLALIIVYASPTATPPSGRLTSWQKEQVLCTLCFHSSCFLSSSLLSPLGFPHLNIKPDPTESVLQFSPLPVKCFQRLVWQESLVSRMKWSITCVCLAYCAVFFGSRVQCHPVSMYNTLSFSLQILLPLLSCFSYLFHPLRSSCTFILFPHYKKNFLLPISFSFSHWRSEGGAARLCNAGLVYRCCERHCAAAADPAHPLLHKEE